MQPDNDLSDCRRLLWVSARRRLRRPSADDASHDSGPSIASHLPGINLYRKASERRRSASSLEHPSTPAAIKASMEVPTSWTL